MPDPLPGPSSDLEHGDPAMAALLGREAARQIDQIELIASENIVSPAVRRALGSEITNKTVEGYPGRRVHGGAHVVDEVETLAIERAKELFGAGFANVQPHSGSQANQAVFVALLQPGDTILSMALSAGGHLSHGAPPNLSGRWFDVVSYGVDPATGLMDYEEMARLADQHRPRLIIAGGSAYPRTIAFEPFRDAADRVGAHFLADIAHIAGLVAGRTHPSPIGVADVVSCTTTKTLRGPRGGLLLTDDETFAKQLDSSVFPGTQGSIHLNNIAAKAVCLAEALQPGFRDYAHQLVANARVLGSTLESRGLSLVSGGTDTHLLLVDVSATGLTGDQAEKVIEHANLTYNKNALPGDPTRPADWTGVRLGVAAATTRVWAPTRWSSWAMAWPTCGCRPVPAETPIRPRWIGCAGPWPTSRPASGRHESVPRVEIEGCARRGRSPHGVVTRLRRSRGGLHHRPRWRR